MSERPRTFDEDYSIPTPSFLVFLLCMILGVAVWLVPLYWAETIGYGWAFAIIALIHVCLFIMTACNTKDESPQLNRKAV